MLMILMMNGCTRLSEDEACELSQRWLRGHGIVMADGEQVWDPTVTSCSNFQSRNDVGEAEIAADIEWSTGGDGFSTTFTDRVNCYLVRYDQGWGAEACIDH